MAKKQTKQPRPEPEKEYFTAPSTRTLQVPPMRRPVKFLRGSRWEIVEDGATRQAVSEASSTVWRSTAAALAKAFAQPETAEAPGAPGDQSETTEEAGS